MVRSLSMDPGLHSLPPRVALACAFALLLLGAGAPVRAAPALEATRWDVLVVGSEPEGVAAAVAAAEAGAEVALVTPDARIGGLFVLGRLNVLDIRSDPPLQGGLFDRWWERVGGGNAFDVARAEAAFEEMLREAGVRVALVTGVPTPLRRGARVAGVRLDDGREVRAAQVVDATADADLAHAAGARFDFGWRGLGLDARMADTLVFRVEGVDWEALRRAARQRGRGWATVDARVAWGPFGGVPAAYPAQAPGVRLRGLNLGRQDDGSVLVNALLVYGVDPFDPASRAEGRRRAEAEARRVVPWLRERLPGFAAARFGGVAERLYVRETRHLRAQCVLDADHVLDHETGPFDVAAGGYPLDVQTLTPHDDGYVFGTPEVYGIPLCVSVPREVSHLWVVGRSAGFDPVAHGSTRVVPTGMAVAEGVGLAAARAAEAGLTPEALAVSASEVARLRERLRARGAYLPPPDTAPPAGPHEHPHFRAFRTLLGYGLALGGYGNAPDLDGSVTAQSFTYLLAEVAKRPRARPDVARTLVDAFAAPEGRLDAERAARVLHAAACELGRCPQREGAAALAAAGLWAEEVPREGALTRGQAYALATALLRGGTGRAAR